MKRKEPRYICREQPVQTAVETGLSEAAAAMVAGQRLPKRTLLALERMLPAHQQASLSIMLRQDNLTGDFARALLAATPSAMRIDDGSHRHKADLARNLAGIVHRLTAAQTEAERLRTRHSENLRLLTLAAGWARTWIHDDVIAEWLGSRHSRYAAALGGLVNEADFAIAPRRRMKLAYEPVQAPRPGRRGATRSKRRTTTV